MPDLFFRIKFFVVLLLTLIGSLFYSLKRSFKRTFICGDFIILLFESRFFL